LILNADGTVDRPSVRVLHSVHPAIDAEAVRYAVQASFWPACLNGRPVRVRISMPIDFKISRAFRLDYPRGLPNKRLKLTGAPK